MSTLDEETTYASARCDVCGARAQTSIVVKEDLAPLHMCGHHLRMHRSVLDDQGCVYFVDDDIRTNVFFEDLSKDPSHSEKVTA